MGPCLRFMRANFLRMIFYKAKYEPALFAAAVLAGLLDFFKHEGEMLLHFAMDAAPRGFDGVVVERQGRRNRRVCHATLRGDQDLLLAQ